MERIEERSFWKLIVFSILTGGIYKIWFYYCIGRDVNIMCEGDGQETQNYLLATLLGGVTFKVYLYYWVYQLGQRLHVNAPRYGYKTVEDGWHLLGLNLLPGTGMIGSYILISNVNKMAERYNASIAG